MTKHANEIIGCQADHNGTSFFTNIHHHVAFCTFDWEFFSYIIFGNFVENMI